MMQRTRVKICGLTRVQDVRAACALGADAVGFVCHRASARYVPQERLAELAAAVAPLVTPVLLFVDAPPEQVARALLAVPGALLQFHGSEDHDYCRAHGRPYLRALAMAEGVDLLEFERAFPSAAGLLADTPALAGAADAAPAGFGGSGRPFAWKRLPLAQRRSLPLVLAGGLRADNVADAICLVRPHAVDVSSGVEESRGIKSIERMRGFMAAVASADASLQTDPDARVPGGAA